jgi:hypothetical protein
MDMGDMATVGDSKGINWRWMALGRLDGRAAEHLLAPDGSRIEPAAIIHLIGVLIRPEWLKRFQVIQSEASGFEIPVEVWGPVSEDNVRVFAGRAAEAMTKLCRREVSVRVRVVDQIIPSASGKHSYCIYRMGGQSKGGRSQLLQPVDDK